MLPNSLGLSKSGEIMNNLLSSLKNHILIFVKQPSYLLILIIHVLLFLDAYYQTILMCCCVRVIVEPLITQAGQNQIVSFPFDV